jgi:hypothetical protein
VAVGHHVFMSIERPHAEHETGLDAGKPPPPVRWIVWRQDDNGNRFEVVRTDSRAEAVEVTAVMKARGHKQTYWVAKATAPSP